jgi:hypothetical protein
MLTHHALEMLKRRTGLNQCPMSQTHRALVLAALSGLAQVLQIMVLGFGPVLDCG